MKFPKENKESIRQLNELLPMTVDFTKPGGSGFDFGQCSIWSIKIYERFIF